jgi:hypothetical protein
MGLSLAGIRDNTRNRAREAIKEVRFFCDPGLHPPPMPGSAARKASMPGSFSAVSFRDAPVRGIYGRYEMTLRRNFSGGSLAA